MPDEYMDESAPAMAGSEDASVANEEPKEDATPENKVALVQSSFFREPPKPGDREMVEIVDVYENEVSIKCVYDEEEEEEPMEEPGLGMSDQSAPSEAEDAMMA
jgi:hypothetical protein